MKFSMEVLSALNNTGYEMQGHEDANRELRAKIAQTCAKFPGTPGLAKMRFDEGSAVYYPVVFASASGMMGFKTENRALLGVSMAGIGASSSRYGFDNLLIGFSDFNEHTIENVLFRALRGDPMSFRELQRQKGAAGTKIVNYGDDNTIGGRDASRW